MKPAIIKRSALLLALACVLALLGAPRASAANQVADIRIKAVLQDDGSADITQTWTATTDEGTEFYLACRDNGYLSITDFTVSDEPGTYEPLASWDVDADFTQKARKCGVVETGEGVELCWGISEYGTHTYTLRYTLHGLVGGLRRCRRLQLPLHRRDGDFPHRRGADPDQGRRHTPHRRRL